MITEAQITCPFCGEEITVFLDCSEQTQTYTEDCSVCCRPILISITCTDGELESIAVKREN